MWLLGGIISGSRKEKFLWIWRLLIEWHKPASVTWYKADLETEVFGIWLGKPY